MKDTPKGFHFQAVHFTVRNVKRKKRACLLWLILSHRFPLREGEREIQSEEIGGFPALAVHAWLETMFELRDGSCFPRVLAAVNVVLACIDGVVALLAFSQVSVAFWFLFSEMGFCFFNLGSLILCEKPTFFVWVLGSVEDEKWGFLYFALNVWEFWNRHFVVL